VAARGVTRGPSRIHHSVVTASPEPAALDLSRQTKGELVQALPLTRLRPLLVWAVCIGFSIAAYGSSLRAGIMFDAALDLPRATERGWLDLLTNAGASPYYRPVTLLVWKACFELLGHNDFVLLHALSLASHAVCGWLVYALSRRLVGFWPGLLASLLFLWFPLSYQVVGFVDSQFHSLAALWALAAAVLYWDARRHDSRWRLAAALVSAGLAMLTHESTAALLAPAIFGLELVARKKHEAFRIQKPALFALETLAFGAIWILIPRWPTSLRVDLPSIRLNAAYFIQALGYPLTMQLGGWPRLGNDALEALLASCLLLALLLALAAVHHRLPACLFGLAWFALAVLPSCLLLPWPNYVIDAPRLLYGASAGIALLWAAALAPADWAAAAGSWRSRLLPASGAVAAVAVLAVSWRFIAERERLLDRGAAVVSQLIETATKPGPDGGRVYVNIPAFVGPKQPDFLLGHAGVTMLPDYFGLDLEVAAATGEHLPIRSLAYDDLAQPWDLAYGLQGPHVNLDQAAAAVQGGGGVYVSRFEPGRLGLEYVGGVAAAASPPAPMARFGDWAELDGASVQPQNGSLAVRLVWHALAPAPGDYTIFVHAIGDQPEPLLQSDGYPVGGLLPPRLWRAGNLIEDERTIRLPSGLRQAPLNVLVGLYDRANPAVRAQAVDSGGNRLAGDAVVIPISQAGSS
jgi:hypothetical protein